MSFLSPLALLVGALTVPLLLLYFLKVRRQQRRVSSVLLWAPALRDQQASALSHGAQRQLEIAMVLATSPAVLLLDEPLAGMGADEAQRMVELLKKLGPDHAMLLVEHDMDAVFAVADVITVMVNGQVLESGPPAQIRASPAVRQAYLGDDDGPPGASGSSAGDAAAPRAARGGRRP